MREIETATTWVKGGVFVSDCAETMAGMYVVRDSAGEFVAAFQTAEARDKALTSTNSFDALVTALRDILPLAEDYLRNAPSHPDHAKLEDARAALAVAGE